MDSTQQTEQLRRKLLENVYAGAFSGLGAMLLDEEQIRRASPDELELLAQSYGIR